MKILLVDDQELHRKVLGARLRKSGHAIIEASDGVDALTFLEKGSVDAVISDVLMPKMDGYELCQTIRDSSSLSHLPLVLYSAIYTSSEDEKNALVSGADLFFRKPVSEVDILSGLHELVGRTGGPRSRTEGILKSEHVLKEYSARLVEKLEEKNEELEASEAKFRTLVKTVASAIFIYKTDRILYANPAAEELTGYAATELFLRTPLDIIYPDDRELATRRLFMGGGIVEASSRIDLRMITKTGAVKWVDFSAGLIEYEGATATIGTVLDITRRKEAEQRLKVSEEGYRELVENSLGLMCMHDLEGRLLNVNPAASEKLGYHPVEMIGRDLREFLAPSVRYLFAGYLERIRKEETAGGQMRVITRDGRERTWLYHNVLRGRTGVSLYVLGHALDITDQQEVEERLRKNEEQLRTIIAAEPECVKITDAQGTILQMNPAGVAMVEAPDEASIVGRSVYDLIKADYHGAFRKLTNGIFSGKKGQLEFEIIGLNGTSRWLETNAVPLRRAENDRLVMLSVTRDITERKRAEEKIREQIELLDVDPAAIYSVDNEGRVFLWNKTAERLYGWTKEEMTGTILLSRFKGESAARHETAVKKVTTEGKWKREWVHQKENGNNVIVESDWTLVKDEDGKAKYIYMVDYDITEKKALEEQLFRSQRMESLGLVSGGIAHDLNNVLGPILLAVEILRKQVYEKKARRLVEIIETSARRGSEIVKLILGFARGTEGERSLVRPGHLAGEIAQFIGQTFPKSIRLVTHLPGDLWSIHGNATHLHQVLTNLCVNARDAMPGGGEITLTGENLILDEHYTKVRGNINPGPYVLLTVTDTGVGIPENIRQRVFEPFFTTKEAEKGTGLGLSVVAGIVQNHGGFVNVYSEGGKGAVFKIYLPAARSPETEVARKRSSEVPHGHGETVLLVDDEPMVLEVTKATLESYGYRTLAANDGTEAIGLYVQQKEQIDLVLCDIAMPYMDGPSTIRAIRKINPDVKVVVVSGFPDAGKSLDEFGPTVRAFVAKPYSGERLLKVIHAALMDN